MIQKKKVLVTIPRIPYPINSGGRYATYETLKILDKYFDVYLIIINDEIKVMEYENEIKKYTVEYFSFSYPKYKFYLNALKSFFNGKPLQVNYFYFKDVQLKIDEILHKVDFCYLFMNRTGDYFFKTDKPVIFNAIDSMYLNYTKSIEKSKSIFWKIIYRFEVKKLFLFEKKCVERFKLSLFVNNEEANFWKCYGNVLGLPFGIEEKLLEYSEESEDYQNNIAFLGRMDYPPNIDAVEWFCKNCLNKLDEGIQLSVIGGFPTANIKKLEILHSNVKILGFVDDPFIILKSSLCVIAPMQTGGGLQTKILMAMAVGGIVIVSPLCMSAIFGAENNVHLIVEDNPSKIIEIINDIRVNNYKYIHIKKNAQKFILENFSWSIIEKMMIENIDLYL